MKDLAKVAADSVRNDEVKFVPKRYEKMYFNWLDNIQDWCISRQLWWGHRIPAYYCKDCNHINVSREKVTKCEKCSSTNVVQDEDTLDTWFSSALWPFSTLGWPEETEDYKYFYPTNVLVTGYDIITFWVSRMMTQGLKLTGKKPFKDVLVHGIVRDSQGRKMSKSLGNGIDPIEVIDKYGTDSLRFSLILGISAGNDIRYMPEKLDQASNFANKIWNAAKFITMNIENEEDIINLKNENMLNEKLHIEDKWIINKLDKTIVEVTRNMENYDLGVALDKVYNFIWDEFCDWYIEMVKPRLYSENKETKLIAEYVLNSVFRTALKLLHPFMPFVTSEIYSKLVKYDDKDLMISDWPTIKEEFDYDTEENQIEEFKKLIVDIRNIRTKMNVHPSKKSKLIFVTSSYKLAINSAKAFIQKLGFADEIIIQENKEGIPENAISIMENDFQVFIPFEDLVDLKEEKERLETEKKKLEAEVQRGEKMLSNPGFINKAPEAKINEEKEKLSKYKEMLQNVVESLEKMNNINS